jgi:hypothetical protein
MSGASGNTAGKIHLGYLYALDETLNTQRRMLTGALTFGPLLDRWLGAQRWEEMRSPLFRYAVMPDSLLDADALEARYTSLRDAWIDVRSHVEDVVGVPASYLGRPFSGRILRHEGDDDGPLIDDQRIETIFETEEVAVDPDRLSDAVRRGLSRREVEFHPRIEIREARRAGNGFAVAVTEEDGVTAWWRAPIVVNCLWDDRLRVDASVGIESRIKRWTSRGKQLVVVSPPRAVHAPTVTMVQGPYGDVIPWDPRRVCLSWYPAGSAVGETVAAITRMFPALEGSRVVDVRSGVVVAPGESDIDDPASGLHVRANPAVHQHEGWWTIDTGAYSLAPLLGYVASRQIDAALRS